MKHHIKIKGFTLIEIIIVVTVINIMAALIIPTFRNIRFRAKNATIVATMANIDSAIDLSKYPGSLANICNDFEPGGEFANIRSTVESHGGIWNCDSTVSDFRIFAQLNQEVVIAQNMLNIPYFIEHAFAQGGNSSTTHGFGNFYCLNSRSEKNFTHWSGNNLTYPSCSDADYIPTPVDPVPNPAPTPGGTPVPPPATSCSGGKVAVCHFGNTLCVSSNALNAHTKHGDTPGSC